MRLAVLLLGIAFFLFTAQGQDKAKPAEPKPPEQKEITGAPALKVLVLHWRAVAAKQQMDLLQSELARFNAEIPTAIEAACVEAKISPCTVVAVRENSITVEKRIEKKPEKK